VDPVTSRSLAAVALVALAAACSRKEPQPGLGRRLWEGPVAAVRPSADGAWLAWLDGCAPVKGVAIPAGTAACDLRVMAAGGGEAVRVARGVSTLPGGFAWSAEGHVLAALDGHDATSGAGTLVAWLPGGAPRRLGEGISFWAFAPRGWSSKVATASSPSTASGSAPGRQSCSCPRHT
jgi:hypothetical protein